MCQVCEWALGPLGLFLPWDSALMWPCLSHHVLAIYFTPWHSVGAQLESPSWLVKVLC